MITLIVLGIAIVRLLHVIGRARFWNARADWCYFRLMQAHPEEAAKPCWRRHREIVRANRKAALRMLAAALLFWVSGSSLARATDVPLPSTLSGAGLFALCDDNPGACAEYIEAVVLTFELAKDGKLQKLEDSCASPFPKGLGCTYWLVGMEDAIWVAESHRIVFCMPKAATVFDQVATVQHYIRAHSTTLSAGAGFVIYDALQWGFACPTFAK